MGCRHLISEEHPTAAFDKKTERTTQGTTSSHFAADAGTPLTSIINTAAEAPATASGNTRSYLIYCDAVPTVHFIFVKDPSTDTWQHALTTNTVSIYETHDWYYVTAQDGTPCTYDDTAVFVYTEALDTYSSRLTTAIEACQGDSLPYTDMISGYTVTWKGGSADGGDGEEIFTLKINCPKDPLDLFDTGSDHTQGIVLAGVIAGIICVGGILLFKKKSAVIHSSAQKDGK